MSVFIKQEAAGGPKGKTRLLVYLSITLFISIISYYHRVMTSIPKKSEELQELERQHARMNNRIIIMGFGILAIFAVPAFLAVWLAPRFIEKQEISVVVLIVVFILAWALVSFLYRRLQKKFMALSEKIRIKQQEEGFTNPENKKPW